MEMTEFRITIPKEMSVHLTIDEDRTELEQNAMMIYPYIKNLTISHGRAAEILGISKWELITLHQRKLGKLQDIKKFMLRNMFPQGSKKLKGYSKK